jgi:hypothetical protein
MLRANRHELEKKAAESLNPLRWLRQTGALLCAFVVIFIIAGLQQTYAADDPIASEIKLVHLVISENVVVVKPPVEPKSFAIPANGLNLRKGGWRDWAKPICFNGTICSDHVLQKIFENNGMTLGVYGVWGDHRTERKCFDNPRRFPIVLEAVLNREISATGNSPLSFDAFDDVEKVVVFDHDKKTSSLGGECGIAGLLCCFSGDAGRSRQTDSENSQDGCEYRDYQSAESGDNRILVSNVSTNTVPVRWERTDENGDAFLKMLGGWIVLSVAFYALLKIQ